MAGICSITSKERGLISLPYETSKDIVDDISRKIKALFKELDASSTTPTVLCTFPGADLIKANNRKATGRHPQQNILNEAMIEINDFILDLNLTRGFSTPMLYSAVHRCHRKGKDGSRKYRHHYCRLEDGIHPSHSTLDFWVKRLQEDFEQFTFNFETL